MRREQVAQWADKIAASTPERDGMQPVRHADRPSSGFREGPGLQFAPALPRLVFRRRVAGMGKPTLTVMLGDEITAWA